MINPIERMKCVSELEGFCSQTHTEKFWNANSTDSANTYGILVTLAAVVFVPPL